MNIDNIVKAMQDRNSAWIGVYKAFAEETLTAAKLAVELNEENSAWGQAGLGKASAQTISNYRAAWEVAQACPATAARVGKDGQIHKAISYATSKGVTVKSVQTWTKHTTKAVLNTEGDERAATLTAALKELRELAKNKEQANKAEEAETVETVETVEDEIINPDEMVWQAVDLLRKALEYVGGVSIDAAQDAAATASILFDALMADLDQAA